MFEVQPSPGLVLNSEMDEALCRLPRYRSLRRAYVAEFRLGSAVVVAAAD